MPVFIDVEYLAPWRLFVVLSDGTTGELDLAPWRTQPLLAGIDDERSFARVSLDDHHRLSWPCGCVISAHDVYHLIATGLRFGDPVL
ncbi:DUF2442 domain-containing protein [Aeromonas schubertii]|uniref:DUF2442 domain-containing protein n=1 Tax=Aeromonas schubertii TaxID=652 RepID=A0A0S2SM23_9GAMM|nr:DUF2442 domain-containing protein [Aeromonas schubertii]ALP42768.1 hypothetical protein WL1483_3349 [Aeromonas schubertii]KUE80979.1 hypothetical protein ATO46_13945 [Aeromonas schubertii]MBZ6064781.1 DUF2442 domain-containing protein [Aeromonas schubertii]MBZ6073316.1 DUF2442 domain-containing protein [Aeromonas schubertii]QCG46724.1 DUF2442 domain-containing protein [Aeromonas schubertii]